MPQPLAPIAPTAPQQPVAPQIPGDGGLFGANGGNPLPASGPSVQPISAWPSWNSVAWIAGQNPAAPPVPAGSPGQFPSAQQTTFGPMAGAPQYQQPLPTVQPWQHYQPPAQQPFAPPQQYLQGMPPPAPWQPAPVPTQMLAGPFGDYSPAGGGGAAPVSQPPQAPVGQPPAGLGAAPAAAPAGSTALRDALLAQGVAVNQYANDEQLLADMGESLAELHQLQYKAQQYEALARERALGSPPSGNGTAAPSQAQPSQPAPGSPARAPSVPVNGEPEWRPEWDGYVRRDPATGMFAPVGVHVNPAIVDRANERAAWLASRSQRLVSKPADVAWEEGIEARVQAMLDQRLAARDAASAADAKQSAAAAEVEQFVTTNATVLFQQDATGRTLINPVTQQPVLTTRGQAFHEYAGEYSQGFQQQYGRPPDPRDAVKWAQMRIQVDEAGGRFGAPVQVAPQQQPPRPNVAPPLYPPQQPQYAQPQYNAPHVQPPSQPTTPPNSVQRALQMNGAAYNPNAQGTLFNASPLTPQNPYDRNLGRMLRNAAHMAGVLPSPDA